MPAKKSKSPSIKLIEQALEESFGIVALAAKKLGIRREALHRRILKAPHLRQIIKEGRTGALCDVAESVLLSHLQQKDLRAAMYVLDTQGKERGYTRRIEAETTNEVIHEFPDAIPIKLVSDKVDLGEV